MRTRGFEKEQHSIDQATRFATGEYNVCGVVMDVNPQKMAAITQAINLMTGCAIHQIDPCGRIALTVEDTVNVSSYDQMNALQQVDGVLAVHLMSHFFE